MNEQIALRPYRNTHRKALEAIVRETWKYDRFCSPRTARRLARVYLNSCLANQTFAQVAEVDGVPAGIILAKDISHHRPPLSLRLRGLWSAATLALSPEGRRVSAIFPHVQAVNRDLLAACPHRYQGELVFFALREAFRGKGLGRKLFQAAVEYMRAQGIPAFYLFTDTSCNYPFYEHLGLRRVGEMGQVLDANGKRGDMTFFLYEYQIP